MKKYLGGMIAIVIAVTAAAFTNHKENKSVKPYPYNFSYNLNTVDGESDSTNYTLITGEPGVQCEGGDVRCVINANKNASNLPTLMSGLVEVSFKPEQNK